MSNAQKPWILTTDAIGIFVGENIVEIVLPNGDEIRISHYDWLQAVALMPHREPRTITAVKGG